MTTGKEMTLQPGVSTSNQARGFCGGQHYSFKDAACGGREFSIGQTAKPPLYGIVVPGVGFVAGY